MTANVAAMATYDQLWHTAAAQLPENAFTTAMLATALFVLLVPRLRKLVWDTVETILASLLLVVLVLVVLGLPFGAAYITFKGAMFVLRSLAANFPQIRELVDVAVHRLKR